MSKKGKPEQPASPTPADASPIALPLPLLLPLLPADVVARLRDGLAVRPKYLAIPIDTADVRAILAAVDASTSHQEPQCECTSSPSSASSPSCSSSRSAP